MNLTSGLNYLDQAEGLPISGYFPNSPQAQIAQGRMRQLVSPMDISDNSNMINAGANSQAQALGMMNTQAPQLQSQRGLIGRMFDSAKSQTTANAIGSTPILNSMQTGMNNAVGGVANYVNPWSTQPTTQPQNSQPQPKALPAKEHLGESMGDGYYKLNDSYHNQ